MRYFSFFCFKQTTAYDVRISDWSSDVCSSDLTPAHIVPEWYFWPFYAILRAFTFDFLFVPAKLLGVMAMFASILLLFFLPWLDRSPVRSGNYRPLFKQFFWVLVVD